MCTGFPETCLQKNFSKLSKKMKEQKKIKETIFIAEAA